MASFFKVWRVEEPDLVFGGKSVTSDPRFGILNFGPYSSLENGEVEVLNVRLGIVGEQNSIDGVLKFLSELKKPIPPNNVITGVFGFPGLRADSPIRMDVRTHLKYQETISSDRLQECLSLSKRISRLRELTTIFIEKMRNMGKKDPVPDLVICAVSKEMIQKCKRRGFKTNRLIFRERKFRKRRRLWHYKENDKKTNYYGDYNFHNVLKVIGMEENLPTQILYHDVWEKGLLKRKARPKSRLQDRVTLAWNFSMGLFYKASGIPWKFTQLKENTLYAGIEFFPEVSKDNQVMRSSMAQIFLQTGESFILRGDAFEWSPDKKDLSPHLSFEQAEILCEQVLNQYYELQGKTPLRIVIHKSSNFYKDELSGFKESTEHISFRDFITIMDTPMRFFRVGKEPIIRGTVISTKTDHFLFTTGFTPSLMKYPGKGVPEPILIRPFYLDSKMKDICQEILAMTKLDWNNIYYNIRLPVTLSIADKVGEILSEPRTKKLVKPLIQYRYYM